jgi:ketosteroid isomerase-like protein
MSRADIETLRAEYEAFSRRDWDAAFSEAHPDFELRPPESGPEAATVRGPDAARRAFADFFEPYDEVAVEPQQFFERGDRIVVFFLQRSRPRGSSATLRSRPVTSGPCVTERPPVCRSSPSARRPSKRPTGWPAHGTEHRLRSAQPRLREVR